MVAGGTESAISSASGVKGRSTRVNRGLPHFPAMYRLYTFGGLSIASAAGPLPKSLRTPHLALLARVAASGERGVRRDELLAMFWPESDDTHARGSLKQAIYSIRQGLHAPEVIVGTDQLRLDPTILSSDVIEFQAALERGDAAHAVALYRGPFLHAVHIGNGEFSRWRDLEAERLTERYGQALTGLAELAEASGHLDTAIRHWEAVTNMSPLSAGPVRQLMRVLARTGERARAVSVGRAFLARVKVELAAPPDVDILRAIDALSREAPAPAIAPLPVMNALPAVHAPASVRVRMRRRLSVGAPVLAALAALAIHRFAPYDDRAISVRVSGVPADTSYAAVIRRAIGSIDPTATFRPAQWKRYRFLVSVQIADIGGIRSASMEFVDRMQRRRVPFDPVSISRADGRSRLDGLGRLLGVHASASRRRETANWGYAAALPSNRASYETMVAGIAAQPFVNGAALDAFDRSAALDSSSATPLIWKALVLSKWRRFSASDAVLRQLAASERRHGEWDRAMIEVLQAWNRGDLTRAHAAGHSLLSAVPNSEWALIPSYHALLLGRTHEALELMKRVPAEVRWAHWWLFIARGQALHLAGEHDKAARYARGALSIEPDRSLARQFLIAALAGMGREGEVERLCIESLEIPPHDLASFAQPCIQAMVESWAHGNRNAANRLADRYVAMLDVEPIPPEQRAVERAYAYVSVGQWPRVLRELAGVDSTSSNTEALKYLVLARAWAADHVEVQALRRRLALLQALDARTEAGVAALLGDRDVAVAWLTRALRESPVVRTWIHVDASLESLHGYARFEELTKPRHNLAHRASYASAEGRTLYRRQ